MKKIIFFILLLFVSSYSQGRFLYYEGFANNTMSIIDLEFYCWSFLVNNYSGDTLYVSTDYNMLPQYTIKIEPYQSLGLSTYDSFIKLYIRSTGNNSKYKLFLTTAGGRR